MRTGLNMIKPDLFRTQIVIVYIELTKDGLKHSEKILYEFDDRTLTVRNCTVDTNRNTYRFNNPRDYLKLYNAVVQVVILNGSINMLNSLLNRFVGNIIFK